MAAKGDLVKRVVRGLLIFDAVSMPTHWYYDRSMVGRHYGSITGYHKPNEKLPGSIMSLSNTGGGGRGSNQGDIVGTIILHGKKQYWSRGGNFHYHTTLDAGENTLEGSLVRLLVRTITAEGSEGGKGTAFAPVLSAFQSAYVDFLTTPGSHNDSYASTCHRMFFANRERGLPLAQCPDNDAHNVDTIDALTLTVPTIVQQWASGASADEAAKAALSTIYVTRKVSASFEPFCTAFTRLLMGVLNGGDLRALVEQAAQATMGPRASMADMVASSRDNPMVACYIESSFPAMLFFLYKYAEADIAEVALANANAGGENVARGSLLGAVFGARGGELAPWTLQGLKNAAEIDAELDALATALGSPSGECSL